MKKLLATLLIATTISNASICKEIEIRTDDFTGDVSKTHPLDFSTSSLPIRITKHIDESTENYTLILAVKGSDIHAGLKNVDIKFFDGSMYSFPNANVKIRYSNGYMYQTIVQLTSEEVIMLKNKKIQKYRLAIYHRELIPEESIRFNDFVNCLTNTQGEKEIELTETDFERLFKQNVKKEK